MRIGIKPVESRYGVSSSHFRQNVVVVFTTTLSWPRDVDAAPHRWAGTKGVAFCCLLADRDDPNRDDPLPGRDVPNQQKDGSYLSQLHVGHGSHDCAVLYPSCDTAAKHLHRAFRAQLPNGLQRQSGGIKGKAGEQTGEQTGFQKR